MDAPEEFIIVVLDNEMALDKNSKKQYVITTWVTQSSDNTESQTRVPAMKCQTTDSDKKSVTCFAAKVTLRLPKTTKIDDKNEHLLWIHLEEDQGTTSYASLDKVNAKSLQADFPSTRFKRKAPYPIEGGIGYIAVHDVVTLSHAGCILYDMKIREVPVQKACVFVSRKKSLKEIDTDAALEIRTRPWMAETQSGNPYLRKFIDKYTSHFVMPFVYDSKRNSITRCKTVGGPATAGLIFSTAPFTIGRALRDSYVMEDERALTAREKAVDIPAILHAYLEYSSLKRGRNILDLVAWVEEISSSKKPLTHCQLVDLQRWNQIITGAATDAATAIRYTADVSEVHVEGKGNIRVATEAWDSLLAGSLGDDCEGLACFIVGIVNMFRYLDWEDLCKTNPKLLALFQAVRFVRSFFACFMVVGSVSGAYVPHEGGKYPVIGSSEDMSHLGGHGWAMDAPVARLLSMLEECMNKRNEPSDDDARFRDTMFGYISKSYTMAKDLIKNYISKVRPGLPMDVDSEKKMGMLTLEGTGPVVSDLQMLAYSTSQYEFVKALKTNQEVDIVPRLPRLSHMSDERLTDFYKTMVDILGRDLNTFFGGYSARTVTYENGTSFIGAHLEHFIGSRSTGFFVNTVYTSETLEKDETYKGYLKYIIANRPKQSIAEYVYMERHTPIKAHVDFDTVQSFLTLYKETALDYLSREKGNFIQLFCEAAEQYKSGKPLGSSETTFSVTKRPSLFFLDKEIAKKEGHKRYVKGLVEAIYSEMNEHLGRISPPNAEATSNVSRIKVMIMRHSPTTESRIEIMYCVIDPSRLPQEE